MDAEFTYRMILLSLSSFLCGMTLVICVRYYLAWRHRKHDDWRGLLPLHVACVALSYNLMLLYSTVETMIRIGEADDVAWWRGAILIPAYITGFAAMIVIGRLRRKRQLTENL